MIALPSSVQPLFTEAGWRPGRASSLNERVPANHPAANILRAFAGLTIGSIGTGKECARSDVALQHVATLDDAVAAWGEAFRTTMVGIAEAHAGNEVLYADAQGRIFTSMIAADGVLLAGLSFGEAMERLLLGRRLMPMLLPEQTSVPFYGEDLGQGDPRVLTLGDFRES